MKKLFLSLIAAIVAASATFAQNTLVATLSHNNDVKMFYGTYALRDAHAAAVSGDVINLSGGGFQSTNITKAITLRGTGIDDSYPSIILTAFTINIPADDTNRFSMEGIRCKSEVTLSGSFANPYFLKCRFDRINYYNTLVSIKNAMFANCKINGDFNLNGTNTVQFINSYVSGFKSESNETSSATFLNCVIRPYSGYRSDLFGSSQLVNCIIFNNYNADSWALRSTTIATNCIAINYRMSAFYDNSQINPNSGFASYKEVFKDFTGTYNDAQTFELTEGAKTKFLGTDGTEIGIHGGSMPYTSTPSYPRITKMNVASKTTADGKLSVEIEVSAAE